MLQIQENIPLGPKTTMRIGGRARWYAELKTKEECEEASTFAKKQHLPLVVLGSGSNTIFADGVIEALVVRIKAEKVVMQVTPHPAPLPKGEGTMVHVEAGKNLAQLINELAEENLDLSPLTGIPGTIGGAVFGNAGQGQGGIWIGNFVREAEVYVDGAWQTFPKSALTFRYRWSSFKEMTSPLIWSITLEVPVRPKEKVKGEIESILKKRIETQPHVKTAGSCFVSLPDGTPAWKVIDAAGLCGKKVGGVSISEKHANFLIAEKGAKFEDAKTLIAEIQEVVEIRHPTSPRRGTSAVTLKVEMRLIGEHGHAVL